jgi:hypothetical protein
VSALARQDLGELFELHGEVKLSMAAHAKTSADALESFRTSAEDEAEGGHGSGAPYSRQDGAGKGSGIFAKLRKPAGLGGGGGGGGYGSVSSMGSIAVARQMSERMKSKLTRGRSNSKRNLEESPPILSRDLVLPTVPGSEAKEDLPLIARGTGEGGEAAAAAVAAAAAGPVPIHASCSPPS